VDTKFEASFGQNGVDWVDISLVDGFTLPFKFEMFTAPGKKCDAGDGNRNVTDIIDCSALSFHECPSTEDLGSQGSSVNLKVQHPDSGQIVGCYSPCSKLTLQQWGNGKANGHSPWDDSVKEYCCPTPPESPEECRAGPVKDTDFVRAVHRGCPGVYGYAYDDGMGLLQCPSDTLYEVTFYCPASLELPVRPPPLEKPVAGPAKPTFDAAALPADWAGEASAAQAIRWAVPGAERCLDVVDRNPQNGNRLQLSRCSGEEAQQFQFSADGKLRWAADPTFCVDVADHATWNGNRIQLWECIPSDDDQQFVRLTGEGLIHWKNHPEKCLDVVRQSFSEHNDLQLWDCDDDAAPFKVGAAPTAAPTTPPPAGLHEAPGLWQPATDSMNPKAFVQLRWAAHPHKCATIAPPGEFQAYTLALEECRGSKEQQFQLDGEAIRWAAFPEMCVDVFSERPNLRLWRCGDEPDDTQRFKFSSNSPIRWATHANMCVDVTDHEFVAGSANTLRLWNCLDGNAIQDFVVWRSAPQFVRDERMVMQKFAGAAGALRDRSPGLPLIVAAMGCLAAGLGVAMAAFRGQPDPRARWSCWGLAEAASDAAERGYSRLRLPEGQAGQARNMLRGLSQDGGPGASQLVCELVNMQ